MATVRYIVDDVGEALTFYLDALGFEDVQRFGQTIAIELVFQQLRSFTRVELDPELRPGHGFLSPADWRRAFAAAGFDDFLVAPDLERIRDHYARFFTGAVCGRRPAAPSRGE